MCDPADAGPSHALLTLLFTPTLMAVVNWRAKASSRWRGLSPHTQHANVNCANMKSLRTSKQQQKKSLYLTLHSNRVLCSASAPGMKPACMVPAGNAAHPPSIALRNEGRGLSKALT